MSRIVANYREALWADYVRARERVALAQFESYRLLHNLWICKNIDPTDKNYVTARRKFLATEAPVYLADSYDLCARVDHLKWKLDIIDSVLRFLNR